MKRKDVSRFRCVVSTALHFGNFYCFARLRRADSVHAQNRQTYIAIDVTPRYAC